MPKGGLWQPGPFWTALGHAVVALVVVGGVSWGGSHAIERGYDPLATLMLCCSVLMMGWWIMREHTQAEYRLQERGIRTFYPSSWGVDGTLDVVFPLAALIVLNIIVWVRP